MAGTAVRGTAIRAGAARTGVEETGTTIADSADVAKVGSMIVASPHGDMSAEETEGSMVRGPSMVKVDSAVASMFPRAAASRVADFMVEAASMVVGMVVDTANHSALSCNGRQRRAAGRVSFECHSLALYHGAHSC